MKITTYGCMHIPAKFHESHAYSKLQLMASNSSSIYQYVGEPPSDLECVICLEVAEDPRQHEKCGRLICKECLEKLGEGKPCPNCRMDPKYFKDSKSK